MRISPWMLTSMFALSLSACGDDKNETDATTNPTTTGTPMTDGTGTSNGETSGEPTTGQPTTVDPTTGDPPDPTTGPVDPTTGDASTSSTGEPINYDCTTYCDLYASGCDDFNEYENSNEICLAQCKQWPPGEEGAVDGDSLACRLYHVGVANQVDANIHCPHAGPSGDLVCVSADAPNCQDYCDTYFNSCKDKLNVYKDEADCLTQCVEWYPGKDGDVAGDTIGCREYHAGVALGDPDTHCPHAGPGGAMVCVTAP